MSHDRAVEALRHIAEGFTMLADHFAAEGNLTMAVKKATGPKPGREPEEEEKGSHLTGDPVDDLPDEPFPAGGEEEAPAVELKDLQNAARKMISDGNRDKLTKIFGKFKIANLSAADEADYPKLLAELTK